MAPPGYRATSLVLTCALASRAITLVLTLLLDASIADYDTSASITAAPCLQQVANGKDSWQAAGDLEESVRPEPWASISSSLQRLVVWDSVFFVRIAQCGYEHEQMFAFMPLLPMLLRQLALSVLSPLLHRIGPHATLALAGLLISNMSFVLASMFLLWLSQSILKDERSALLAALLFIINPAAIFFSAIYSESLFCMLSFAAMWLLATGRPLLASLLFSLSAATRANGVLHSAFFAFQAVHLAARSLRQQQGVLKAIASLIKGAALSSISLTLFVLFQLHGYCQFCHPLPLLNIESASTTVPSLLTHTCLWLQPVLTLGLLHTTASNAQGVAFNVRGDEVHHLKNQAAVLSQVDMPPRPWCSSRLPYIYSFVQEHYWNVGFLRYFELKQLPNFLLAAPVVALASLAIALYFQRRKRIFLSLGFMANDEEAKEMLWTSGCRSHGLNPGMRRHFGNVDSEVDDPRGNARGEGSKAAFVVKDGQGSVHHRHSRSHHGGDPVATRNEDLTGRDTASSEDVVHEVSGAGGYFSPAAFCFVFQLLAMLLTAVLVMHVQVATRFLATSPVLYWFLGSLLSRNSSGKRQTHWMKFVTLAYCLSYFSLGALLFPNFYPFT